MTETNFKKHASLRGTNAVSDEANQLTEFQRGQSASVTTLTDFATLNRLGCRAHIRSLAMTQCAFTMAEILLSLTIIGVVAAITLPSLMANINERTWNTQRKALYARMSQAIAMMPQLNGYGTLTEDESGSVTADTAAETFLTEGLSKVLKINNICDAEHLADCGITSLITPINNGEAFSLPKTLIAFNEIFSGNFCTSGYADWGPGGFHSYAQTDTKIAAFETQNGESIALYYNPNCTNTFAEHDNYFSQPNMCANFIYDLNGSKGPNATGKDIGFITAIYPMESVVVAPMPESAMLTRTSHLNAVAACKDNYADSRLPNVEELSSMFYNKRLLAYEGGSQSFVTSSKASSAVNPDGARILYFTTGRMYIYHRSGASGVWCIKR